MVQLAIIDQTGKVVEAKDVATAAELKQLVEQARGMIRECERLAQLKSPGGGKSGVPYL